MSVLSEKELSYKKKGLLAGTAKAALLAICAAMSFSVTGSQPEKPQERIVASVETPEPSDIRTMKADFAKTPLGREMLQFARKHDIRFKLDPNLKVLGNYNDGNKTITLSAKLDRRDKPMILAHELRHAWQDRVLGHGKLQNTPISPEQYWTLRQYIEADACAFSAYYMADRMQQLDEKPHPQSAYGKVVNMAGKLRQEMKSADGLTLREYRQNAVETCFRTLSDHNTPYPATHLAQAENHVNNLLARAKTVGTSRTFKPGEIEKSRKLVQAFQNRITDDDFEAWLRRMGGMSLLPSVPTSLQQAEVSRDTIFRDYPLSDHDGKRKQEFSIQYQIKMTELDSTYSLSRQWVETVYALRLAQRDQRRLAAYRF